MRSFICYLDARLELILTGALSKIGANLCLFIAYNVFSGLGLWFGREDTSTSLRLIVFHLVVCSFFLTGSEATKVSSRSAREKASLAICCLFELMKAIINTKSIYASIFGFAYFHHDYRKRAASIIYINADRFKAEWITSRYDRWRLVRRRSRGDTGPFSRS
jgi:hypothetical protein